jgi:hypothetical protein
MGAERKIRGLLRILSLIEKPPLASLRGWLHRPARHLEVRRRRWVLHARQQRVRREELDFLDRPLASIVISRMGCSSWARV